jgi:hypothetical protein
MQTQQQENKVVELVAATGFADPEYPRNPYLIRVYKTREDLSTNDNYKACVAMLRWCMIPHKEIVDLPLTMKLSRGHQNPAWGFILVTPDDSVIRDFMGLTDWIKVKGMMPL